MQFDIRKIWPGRLGQPAARKVPARRPKPSQLEELEDRFLLGELAPSSVLGMGLSNVPSEVATSESTTLPSLAIQSTAVAPTSGNGIIGNSGSSSQKQIVVADSAAVTVATSKTTISKQLKSDLQADKAAQKSLKSTAQAEKKAERKAEKEQRKANKNSGGPSSNPGTSTGGDNSTPTGSGSPGTGTPTPPTTTPTDPTTNPGSGTTTPPGGTGGTTGGSTTTDPGSSSSHSPETTAPLVFANPQLTTTDVQQLLDRASAATPSNDAIIVVVDRQGNILGVRTEAAVQTADVAKLVFSIDGAVAEARTAAFFSNDQAPLTSRTVRFISQTTITEREVDSNPSITDMNSTIAGPGFVAPIGLGGHFPPGVAYTPVVDLFGIEATNRDSIDSFPGGEGRFDADYIAGQEIDAPGSYGVQSGLKPDAQPRGIATLPGGIPLYRDADGNGVGETLVGGIGVFFPGPDGYASYEQGFVHGDGKSTTSRTNASRVLEAEYIALSAIGSSRAAGIVAGSVGGVAPVPGIDLPFGRIDLVGITLEEVGPTAGIEGVNQLLKFGANLGPGVIDGTDQMVSPAALYLPGEAVPSGWLVAPHAGSVLTAADVTTIINHGIAEAMRVRAAIRLPLGQRTRMVFAVTDTDGEVLGLYRMDDATYFSLDVAVAKARNVAYYDDPTKLKPADQVLSKNNIAFTSRTFRFLVEPRYPSGVDGTKPGPFSILNEASINPKNAENVGAPAPASAFQTVQGYNSFNIGTNFRDTSTSSDNQNGVIFFPGSSVLYKNGVLAGGLGVSGDGVDQDDVVTVAAAVGYNPPSDLKADRYTYRGVRLPYTKFLRNPYG